MKTKLLRKLRKEAVERFQFKITQNCFGTWAFVNSRGVEVKSFLNGNDVVGQAEAWCKKEIRAYILNRVTELRKKCIWRQH